MKQKLLTVSLALTLAMSWTSTWAQGIQGMLSMAQHALNGSSDHATRYGRPTHPRDEEGFGEEVPFEPGATWDCGFSPEGGAHPRVVHAINEVHVRPGDDATILVIAYEFSEVDIAHALIAAKQRGVKVAVVADATESGRAWSKLGMLIKNGIPVRIDNQRQMIHDKVMVLDGSAVEMGSLNFTDLAGSDQHGEDACVIRHTPKLAARFTGHWQKLWRESQPLS